MMVIDTQIPLGCKHPRVALARPQYPHVAITATSLPSYVTEAHLYPSLHAHIRRVVDAYGPPSIQPGL